MKEFISKFNPLTLYLILSAQPCVRQAEKADHCTNVNHYLLIDSHESIGGYCTNQVITQSNSLWLKIDKNIIQEVTIELHRREFVSFSSNHFSHQFIAGNNNNMLRIIYPGLQVTNAIYLLMGDLLTFYKPLELQGITPKAKITYVVNIDRDFCDRDLDFEKKSQEQLNYRDYMGDFVMDMSVL